MFSLMSDFCIAFIELIEAEFRNLKKNIFNLWLGILLLLLSAIALLTGLGLILRAFYVFLLGYMVPELALVIGSLPVFILSGGLLWLAKRHLH